jgi:RimJ/RimL family protein N-acetyltransferase
MSALLETPRLLLCPIQLSDAPQIQALFPQWEVVRYMSARVPWPYPADGALSHIRDVLQKMEHAECWNWTLRPRSEPALIIGSIGLMRGENKNRGFWIGPPWQGRGLMTEACDAVTDFWFEVLKFPRLRAPKAVANTASGRISAKQGMRVVAREQRDFVCGRLPSEIWEITAEEWRARQR